MKFETDSHFLIGKMHINSGKPCQDHALSGNITESAAYAIVTDGCSTGHHTDMGSRILSFATVNAIKEEWERTRDFTRDTTSSRIAFQQQVGIQSQRRILGLSTMDLLATCVYVAVSETGGYIHVQGDGVFAVQTKKGEIFMTRLDWQDNKPCYPVYAEDSYRSYIAAQGGDLTQPALMVQNWSREVDGSYQEVFSQEVSLADGLLGWKQDISSEELVDLEYISVFSDGITQIEGIDWKDAVSQALAFKSPNGEFVKRRLNRMTRDSEKLGKGPLDDIACACVKVSQQQTLPLP